MKKTNEGWGAGIQKRMANDMTAEKEKYLEKIKNEKPEAVANYNMWCQNGYRGSAAYEYALRDKIHPALKNESLSFKDMIKLVQESGGQQQIEPVDEALFTWAQRVAASKFKESTKQEVYAGLVYERMGGIFNMYDVLSESAGANNIDQKIAHAEEELEDAQESNDQERVDRLLAAIKRYKKEK